MTLCFTSIFYKRSIEPAWCIYFTELKFDS